MDRQKINELLEKAAKDCGISMEEVRREIKALAITNLGPLAPEDSIIHLAKIVKDKLHGRLPNTRGRIICAPTPPPKSR